MVQLLRPKLVGALRLAARLNFAATGSREAMSKPPHTSASAGKVTPETWQQRWGLNGRHAADDAAATSLTGRRRTVYTALLLAPLVVILVVWCAFLPTDPDYGWHVRTGQLIAELHGVPRTDPFSFTAVGNAWNVHEWLTELLQYVVQQQVGYIGNVVVFGVLMAITAVAMFRTCRLWGLGELASVALVLWAFGMSLPSAGVRPQTVTRLLVAITALVLTAYVRGRSRRWLWLLPPLFAVWSNLHGGFVFGLGLLGLAVLGEAAVRLTGHAGASPLPLLLVTIASTAASLINPQGVQALLYPLSYAQGNASFTFVSEWQTPDLRQAAFYPFGASMLLALLLGWARRPLGPTHVLWVLVVSLLGLQSIRHISLYATVALPLIGARLAAEIPALRRTVAAWRRPGRMVLMYAGGLLVATALWSSAELTRGTPIQLGRDPDASGYPMGAVDYLKTHHLEGNLFNQYDWGGYLINQLYPEYRVFIDGRTDVYGDALVAQYAAIEGLQPGWQQALARYDIRLVLVSRDTILAAALVDDPSWRELYAGPTERLFARVDDSA
jgi:hypothetical protein